MVTGEEDEQCLYITRGKLYRLGINPATAGSTSASSSSSSNLDQVDKNLLEWVEVGVGPLKILQSQKQPSFGMGRLGKLFLSNLSHSVKTKE